MVGLVFCALAIAATYFTARHSLAAGLKALIVVGYFYGVGRGRYPDMFTHFPFDCSLVTLYAVHFSRKAKPEIVLRSEAATAWTRILVIWPVICLAYGPLLSSSQPIAVQLVGFRGAVLMLPCLILGAQLERSDLDEIAPTVAILNLLSLAFALAEYVFGVSVILPRNFTTENIYTSSDIHAGHDLFNRIPSMFSSAHAYGAVMMYSVPFLIHGLEGGKRVRLLSLAGLASAFIGIFLCGARTPVAMMGLATLYSLFTLRLRASTLLAFAILGAAVYYLVTNNERLQRFESLGDVDAVEQRIGGSVNMSFLDAMGAYPFGAGLASAFGTNIPFFLHDLANDPIGIESEYGHTLIEQGIIGFLLLFAFVLWAISRVNAPKTMSKAATSFASASVVISWGIGAMGVGLLSGVPASAFLLLLTGVRIAAPPAKKAQLALRHVGQQPRGATLPGRAIGPRGLAATASSSRSS